MKRLIETFKCKTFRSIHQITRETYLEIESEDKTDAQSNSSQDWFTNINIGFQVYFIKDD